MRSRRNWTLFSGARIFQFLFAFASVRSTYSNWDPDFRMFDSDNNQIVPTNKGARQIVFVLLKATIIQPAHLHG